MYYNELFVEVLLQNDTKYIQINELDFGSALDPYLPWSNRDEKENESETEINTAESAARTPQKTQPGSAVEQANRRLQFADNKDKPDPAYKLIRNALIKAKREEMLKSRPKRST